MASKANRAYRNADMSDHEHCRHGTFVGDPYGPDYMCGSCEMGFTDLCPVCGTLHFRKRDRQCSYCGGNLSAELNCLARSLEWATIYATLLQIAHSNPDSAKSGSVEEWHTKGTREMENIEHFGKECVRLSRRMDRHYVNVFEPRD